MAFVLDASVVASWLLPDEDHPQALAALERLKTEDAWVPTLLWFELRNMLVVSERRQRLTPAQTAAALATVHGLPLTVDDQADSDTTLQLARAHRLSVYDAVYLELALRRRVPLLTLDAQLATAARDMNVLLPPSAGGPTP
jgi:predicted nucleic acid-binding protein